MEPLLFWVTVKSNIVVFLTFNLGKKKWSLGKQSNNCIFFFLYQDPRFNAEVDQITGYKTQSILCMPIKNHREEVSCSPGITSCNTVSSYASVLNFY